MKPYSLAKTPLELFWAKVCKAGSVCWLWTGGTDPDGYGVFGHRHAWSRSFWEFGETAAHRVSWVIHFGPIPQDLWVLHRCDNPPCVNPAHLWLGDNAANSQDRSRKGRNNSARGEGCAQTPLYGGDVIKIRELWASGKWTQDELAAIYSIRQSCISEIVNRVTWRHL